MKVSWLPAALAYKLIRRGCSPADLATLAMLWPRDGHVPQQTKAGRAIKPGWIRIESGEVAVTRSEKIAAPVLAGWRSGPASPGITGVAINSQGTD